MFLRHSSWSGRCLGVLLVLVASCYIRAGAIGVNYGTVADDLPSPAQVVQLIQSTYINHVKIYSADPNIVSAFANTGITVVVGVTNDQIDPIAASESYAQQWVTMNVASHYPTTDIVCIVVGNEVVTSAPNQTYQLVPAMQNLYTGLKNLGLTDSIMVSTPHSYGVLGTSYPPSTGAFRTDLSGPVFAPMLDFLSQTGAPFMINAYPYFAYRDDPEISISYALFETNGAAPVIDTATGLTYDNLFDAQVDAVYAAMAKLGHQDIKVTVSETGWPSFGDPDEIGISVSNAQTYMYNLLQHINSNAGTPGRPGVPVYTYIFALFNENQKPGPTSERNFGLFNPDMTTVYNVGLVTANTTSSSPPPPTMSTTPSPPPPAGSPPPSSPPPPPFTSSYPPPSSAPSSSPSPPSSPPPSSSPPPPFTSSYPPPSSPSPSSSPSPDTSPSPSSSPPPPFTSSYPPPSTGSIVPPSPYSAPPPPYPVPHVPPTGGSTSPPPPSNSAPQPASSPPPTDGAPPPPATLSPPPASNSSPPPANPSPPGSPPPSPSSPPPSPPSSPPPSPSSPPPSPPSSPPPSPSSPPPSPPSSPPPSPSSPPPGPASAPTTTPSPASPPPSAGSPQAPPSTPQAPPGTPPAPPGTASGPNTWCISKPGATAADLATGLNYACGEGGADCTAIQGGGACYNPDTLFSHASYAFSSYYAMNGRNYWNCFFGNASLITITNPSYAGCNFP